MPPPDEAHVFMQGGQMSHAKSDNDFPVGQMHAAAAHREAAMERRERGTAKARKPPCDYGAWQSMESAPRDGRKILIYTRHGDYEISSWHEIQCWASKRGFFVDAALWTPLPEPPAA